ncbi:hypothetical protein STA3757_14730 [Stanieria sp. NIES-3757]|nr:hypothetical protein STA3757_14730 [Stanieria sp. NIES-3757]
MDLKKISRLLANSTYRELGLRAKEYLQYQNEGLTRVENSSLSSPGNVDGEKQYLAEVTMYNCMVSFLQDLGIEQKQAEEYCDNSDRLTELAQYISSILEV